MIGLPGGASIATLRYRPTGVARGAGISSVRRCWAYKNGPVSLSRCQSLSVHFVPLQRTNTTSFRRNVWIAVWFRSRPVGGTGNLAHWSKLLIGLDLENPLHVCLLCLVCMDAFTAASEFAEFFEKFHPDTPRSPPEICALFCKRSADISVMPRRFADRKQHCRRAFSLVCFRAGGTWSFRVTGAMLRQPLCHFRSWSSSYRSVTRRKHHQHGALFFFWIANKFLVLR